MTQFADGTCGLVIMVGIDRSSVLVLHLVQQVAILVARGCPCWILHLRVHAYGVRPPSPVGVMLGHHGPVIQHRAACRARSRAPPGEHGLATSSSARCATHFVIHRNPRDGHLQFRGVQEGPVMISPFRPCMRLTGSVNAQACASVMGVLLTHDISLVDRGMAVATKIAAPPLHVYVPRLGKVAADCAGRVSIMIMVYGPCILVLRPIEESSVLVPVAVSARGIRIARGHADLVCTRATVIVIGPCDETRVQLL
mmetsp:Transcript_1271/g.3535  ORF Transcript_1271/g.3535 Transcript_1271/m.3535 type:complete len:254 (+) Transcript_1271:1376-2137(+)